MTDKTVLDRVLAEIANAKSGETTAHSSYVSGVFEDSQEATALDPQKAVLDRVLKDIQSASQGETTAHSSYVSGVFED